MLTAEQVITEMKHYSLTQAAVCLGAGIDDSKFSAWLRGRCELPPTTLVAIEHSLAALANICHDGFPWPLDFRSPHMIPLIRKYVAKHESYLREKAAAGE